MPERFVDQDLSGTEFRNVNLAGAQMRNVNLEGAKLMEAYLVNARISGLIIGLIVNDVEVAPLIDAEMTRRYPERAKLRPTDADGTRDAWSVIEQLWVATRARAESLPEELLHERVDDEWSFLETVRHLIMVTDGWIGATVLGRTGHRHPWGVAPSFLTDLAALGIDPDADPSLTEVIPVREERMQVVRDLVDGLADGDLKRQCGEQTLRDCLWTVLDEEWHHNWFANRDLDVLTSTA